jgi:hypothetical protein
MNYNEIMYAAFYDELDKQAGLLGTSWKAMSTTAGKIGTATNKIKNVADKVVYNPTVAGFAHNVASIGPNPAALTTHYAAQGVARGAQAMGAPRLARGISTFGQMGSQAVAMAPG